jgi:hypothetical protein
VTLPVPGVRSATELRGRELRPGAGVEPAISRVKANLPTADGALLEWSRLPVPTRVACLTGARSQPCATAGPPTQAMAVASASRTHGESRCLRRCWVSSVRFERTLPSTCLLPPGYEDVEPPPGADPGHPPYEGGAAAVRGGVGWGIRIRT